MPVRPEESVTAGELIAGEYRHLEAACQRVVLEPGAAAARNNLCRLLQINRCDTFRPGSLARGLAEEAQAHGDDLALRLEQAGSDTVTIRAAATRLCQTLACLRLELLEPARIAGWPLVVRPARGDEGRHGE